MIKKYIFLLLLLSFCANAQVLDFYPKGQYFYEKGELNFLKDLQEIAIKNELKPCKDKEEHYAPKWIVFPDSTIKFIKDTDSINIQKNKCAYDFTKNIFKYLNKWKPAIINETAYPVIATYDINPTDLFLLKVNNDLTNNFEPAEYRGGNTAFAIGVQKLINPIFDRHHLTLNNEIINLRFTISKTGTIEDVDIPPFIPFRIKDELLQAIQGLKKWKPATLNGVPTKQKVSVSLRFGN